MCATISTSPALRIDGDAGGEPVRAELRLECGPSSRSLVAPWLAFGLTLSFILVFRSAVTKFALPIGLDFGFLATYIGNVEDRLRMINEIYNQRILELAGNIPRLGRLRESRTRAPRRIRVCAVRRW